MRAIMLDEFDARILFLPQLEMAIDGGRNDEVRAVFMLRRIGNKGRGEGRTISLYSSCEESQTEKRADVPCNDDKVYHIAMHETLVVPICAWQMVQEKPFMWENYSKGRTLLRTVLLSLA
jgi:hypothetical protein